MIYLEEGQITHDGILKKLSRRSVFKFAERTNGMFASGPARMLLSELDNLAKGYQTPTEREARFLIRKNTLAVGETIAFRPSEFHRDTFLRDLFFVCQYADSPLLNGYALDMFADVQDSETGYIPTSRFAFGKEGFTFKDETPCCYPIRFHQTIAEGKGMVITERMRIAAEKATQYIISELDDDGLWHNKDTSRTYWADELILPENDVVAFKQGMAAVALRAAYVQGIITDLKLVEKVEKGYSSLAEMYGGRLPLSAKTGWIDVSALYPAYLSKVLFDREMINEGVLRKTVKSFVTPVNNEEIAPNLGIPVIMDHNGQYLSEKYFVHPDPRDIRAVFMDEPGNYQNGGGSWIPFEHAAWSICKLYKIDLNFLPEHFLKIFDGEHILKVMHEYNFPEFSRTGLAIGESYVDPKRVGHAGDVAALDQHRRVLALQ